MVEEDVKECSSCVCLKQEIDICRKDQASTLKMIKEKIISTDKLIKKYQKKCDDFEKQAKLLNELTSKYEESQRNTEVLKEELDHSSEVSASQAKTIKRLIQEKFVYEEKIQDLKQKNADLEGKGDEIKCVLQQRDEEELSWKQKQILHAKKMEKQKKRVEKLEKDLWNAKSDTKKGKVLLREQNRKLLKAMKTCNKYELQLQTLKNGCHNMKAKVKNGGYYEAKNNVSTKANTRKQQESYRTRSQTLLLSDKLKGSVDHIFSVSDIFDDLTSLSLEPLSPLPPSPNTDSESSCSDDSSSSDSNDGDSSSDSSDEDVQSLDDLGKTLETRLTGNYSNSSDDEVKGADAVTDDFIQGNNKIPNANREQGDSSYEIETGDLLESDLLESGEPDNGLTTKYNELNTSIQRMDVHTEESDREDFIPSNTECLGTPSFCYEVNNMPFDNQNTEGDIGILKENVKNIQDNFKMKKKLRGTDVREESGSDCSRKTAEPMADKPPIVSEKNLPCTGHENSAEQRETDTVMKLSTSMPLLVNNGHMDGSLSEHLAPCDEVKNSQSDFCPEGTSNEDTERLSTSTLLDEDIASTLTVGNTSGKRDVIASDVIARDVILNDGVSTSTLLDEDIASTLTVGNTSGKRDVIASDVIARECSQPTESPITDITVSGLTIEHSRNQDSQDMKECGVDHNQSSEECIKSSRTGNRTSQLNILPAEYQTVDTKGDDDHDAEDDQRNPSESNSQTGILKQISLPGKIERTNCNPTPPDDQISDNNATSEDEIIANDFDAKISSTKRRIAHCQLSSQVFSDKQVKQTKPIKKTRLTSCEKNKEKSAGIPMDEDDQRNPSESNSQTGILKQISLPGKVKPTNCNPKSRVFSHKQVEQTKSIKTNRLTSCEKNDQKSAEIPMDVCKVLIPSTAKRIDAFPRIGQSKRKMTGIVTLQKAKRKKSVGVIHNTNDTCKKTSRENIENNNNLKTKFTLAECETNTLMEKDILPGENHEAALTWNIDKKDDHPDEREQIDYEITCTNALEMLDTDPQSTDAKAIDNGILTGVDKVRGGVGAHNSLCESGRLTDFQRKSSQNPTKIMVPRKDSVCGRTSTNVQTALNSVDLSKRSKQVRPSISRRDSASNDTNKSLRIDTEDDMITDTESSLLSILPLEDTSVHCSSQSPMSGDQHSKSPSRSSIAFSIDDYLGVFEQELPPLSPMRCSSQYPMSGDQHSKSPSRSSIAFSIDDYLGFFEQELPPLSPLAPSPTPSASSSPKHLMETDVSRLTSLCPEHPADLKGHSVNARLQRTRKLIESGTRENKTLNKIVFKNENNVNNNTTQGDSLPVKKTIKKKGILAVRPQFLSEIRYATKALKGLLQKQFIVDDVVSRLSSISNLSSGTPLAAALVKFKYEEDFMPNIIQRYYDRDRENVEQTTNQTKDCTPLLSDFEERVVEMITKLTRVENLKNLSSKVTALLSKSIIYCCSMAGQEEPDKRLVASNCRLMGALCRKEGDVSRMRMLCYDIMRVMWSRPGTVLYLMISIAGAWPSVLSSPSPPWTVSRGLVHLSGPAYQPLLCTIQLVLTTWVRSNDWVLLGNIIDWLCAWTPVPPGRFLLFHLSGELIQCMKEPSFAKLMADKDGHPVLSFGLYEVVKSIELITCVLGKAWLNNVLIRGIIWDILTSWAIQTQSTIDKIGNTSSDAEKDTCEGSELSEYTRPKSPDAISVAVQPGANTGHGICDATVVAAIRLLGLCCRVAIEKHQPSIVRVVPLLVGILERAQDCPVAHAIQLATAYSLIEVSPWHTEDVPSVLEKWKDDQEQNGSLLPESFKQGLNCLRPESSATRK